MYISDIPTSKKPMSFLFLVWSAKNHLQLRFPAVKRLLRSNVWKQKSWESLVDFSLGCWALIDFFHVGGMGSDECEADERWDTQSK